MFQVKNEKTHVLIKFKKLEIYVSKFILLFKAFNQNLEIIAIDVELTAIEYFKCQKFTYLWLVRLCAHKFKATHNFVFFFN